MFGTIIYMPLFLQLTQSITASHAGLLLMPMMLGQVVASTMAGRLMNLTGRYKFLPLVGLPLVRRRVRPGWRCSRCPARALRPAWPWR